MSDTPRTDAAECRLRYYETQGGHMMEQTLSYIEPEFARDLERELAAVTAERDRLKAELEKVNNEFGSQTAEWPDAWRRVGDLKQLNREYWRELERMRPVVESAQRWRHSNFAGDESELTSAVDAYEAAK